MSDGTPIIIKKVKGHGGHAHHGGSWKVAYADFMTAMMAFFMVMWIMGLSDETKAQVAGYFNDPLGFKKSEAKSHTIVAPKSAPGSRSKKNQFTGKGSSKSDSKSKDQPEVKDADRLKIIQKKIEAAIAGDKQLRAVLKDVEMKMTQDGLRIELVESKDAAFFESGSAVLNPVALKLVSHIAPVLRQQDRYLKVEGHTDSVPYPDPTYTNWDLSSDRANALRRALVTSGINPRRFTGVLALADTQLKVPAEPTNPRNRRVTILLPFKTDPAEGSKLPKDLLPKGPAAGMGDIKLAPGLGGK